MIFLHSAKRFPSVLRLCGIEKPQDTMKNGKGYMNEKMMSESHIYTEIHPLANAI
jgi:hypothetical protein